MYLTFEYVSWYIAAHSALVSESAKERLANLLVALGPSIGEVVSDGIETENRSALPQKTILLASLIWLPEGNGQGNAKS
jgi:hypothetical protein